MEHLKIIHRFIRPPAVERKNIQNHGIFNSDFFFLCKLSRLHPFEQERVTEVITVNYSLNVGQENSFQWVEVREIFNHQNIKNKLV